MKDSKNIKTRLKEKLGHGDNTGIKKFPSVNDPVRYYYGLGRDLWYTVEIDD